MKLFRTFLTALVLGITSVLSRAEAVAPSSPPPLQTLIQRVMQTSAMENTEYHIFNQHYLYRRDRVTEFFDTAGNLKQLNEKMSTNNPVQSALRPRPVAQPASYGKQSSDSQPSIHGVSLGKKEDLLNPDFIKRYTITVAGEEMINGRPAWVLDFKPASDKLPILNIKDRLLNCVAGRGWVDEGDYILEKAELHLTQKVSALGGIAGTVSKFTLSFDRVKTAEGYWFTRDLDWHLEAREATLHWVVSHHDGVIDVQKIR